jgi:hypothetical protein
VPELDTISNEELTVVGSGVLAGISDEPVTSAELLRSIYEDRLSVDSTMVDVMSEGLGLGSDVLRLESEEKLAVDSG